MNKKEYLIIGQGIAGTILSYRFSKLGIKFQVIDDPQCSRSSRIAAGLANPVVLKRQKWVQGAELFTQNLPSFYQEMEIELQSTFFHPMPLYHLFQSNGEINDWQNNASKVNLEAYLGAIEKQPIKKVNTPFGYGKVENIFWVDTDEMIRAWREILKCRGLLIEDRFKADDYPEQEHIYSNGHCLTEQFPAFQNIFTKTKGQVMVIESDDIDPHFGLHSSVFTLPLGNNLFKVGATYEHQNLNDEITPAGLLRLKSDFEKFFSGQYRVAEQLAGVRPNVKDRKPLMGRINDQSLCFNGLGSRGILMAPYLSQHFINYLIYNNEIEPTWDIKRFAYL